jgi:hypothetical protein
MGGLPVFAVDGFCLQLCVLFHQKSNFFYFENFSWTFAATFEK